MSIIGAVLRENGFQPLPEKDRAEGATESWTRVVQCLSGPQAVVRADQREGVTATLTLTKVDGPNLLHKSGDWADIASDAVMWAHKLANM